METVSEDENEPRDIRGRARLLNDVAGLIGDEIAALDKAIGGAKP